MRKLTPAELNQLIEDNSAEAVNVDFKRQWHANNADLILDILCLSNADYVGDRFLLIGVDDSAQLVGVADDESRKTNAQFFDLLSGSNFERLPEVQLYTLRINAVEIDVIHIANTSQKPYWLRKDKSGHKKGEGRTVRAGVVYSRNGSRNTAINETASATEIEQMWRARFGLDQSPIQRFKTYLLDFDNWRSDGEAAHYRPFPEFTIVEDFEKSREPFADDEWTRGEDGYFYGRDGSGWNILKYHQTSLKTIEIVSFDGQRKSIVAPTYIAVGAGRFYYYLEDSVEFAFHHYISSRPNDNNSWDVHDQSLDLGFPFGCNIRRKYAIPRFRDDIELQSFKSALQAAGYEIQGCGQSVLDPSRSKDEQNQIWCELVQFYQTWRQNEDS